MKVKVMIKLYDELRYIKKVVRRFGDVLENGRYFCFPCMRALAISDFYDDASAYFGSKAFQTKFQPIIKILNKTGYLKNTKKTSGKYQALYIANNYDMEREIKLFSFKEKKILTVCISNDECNKQIEFYKAMKDIYNLPRIASSEVSSSAYEISMVELLDKPDEVSILNEILKCSAKNSHNKYHFISVEEILGFNYDNQEMNALLTDLEERISISCNTQLPLCNQHGDLSAENLLYGISDGKKDFWWIDWEHVDNRIFLYDFFFYMLIAAFQSNKPEYCRAYFEGKCDERLEEYFKYFGSVYEKERKLDYFLMFTICFLKERVCDLGNVNILRKYFDFINSDIIEKYK